MTMLQTPIRRRAGATATPRRTALATLFCLPHAGGGASVFARWPAAFGPSVEVRAIQLPGREDRILEDPVIDPDALAAGIARAVTGPYALFGHSMGARLAFEVIRRLRAAGAPLPEVLFASACRAPHMVRDGLLDGLSRADDDAFIARLHAVGGLPDEVAAEPELLELLLPALRADFTWLDDYTFAEAEPLPVPIVCLAGDQDRAVPLDEVLGWERHTSAGFAVHRFAGGHFFLRDRLPELVARIEAALLGGERPVPAPPAAAPAAPAPDRAEHRVPFGRWSVWRDAILRTTGFPADGLDRFAAPECAAAADAWLAGTGSREAFDARFDEAAAAGSREIRGIADDPRFREAVTWQNPSMRHTLDGLARGAYRPSVARHREATVVRYWQRYCAKNETVGFFGPVCWARIDAALPELVDARPGPGMLRERQVFLETWAVQALADSLASDPAVRACLRPRLQPHLAIVGRTVVSPPRPDRALSPVERTALLACTGERTASDVVASLGLPCADDGYLLLERLVEAGVLRWDFDVPTDPAAESVLAARIEAIGDPDARATAASTLCRVQAARDAVAAAAGDADGLLAAMAELDRVFTEATGRDAQRSAGQHYAGRRLCYEDTVRDLDVRFGAGLLAAVEAPLDLMLRAARWLCAELAEVHAAALRELYEELAAERRASGAVNLAELWFLAQGMLFGEGERPADAAAEAFRDRWRTLFQIVGADDGDAPRLELGSEALAGHVDRLFPERGPGWSAGRLHSPDLLLCAASAQALNAGRFSVVLGEMHTAWPTFDNALFTLAHPAPGELVRALASDLGTGRMRLLYPPDWPRGAGRLAPVLAGPTDTLLGFAPAPGAGGRPVVPAAALVVEPDAATGGLVARAPDGRRWPLLEVFGPLVATHAVDAFGILGDRPHTPRVTLDRLVVAREAWRTTVEDTGLAAVTGDRERFLAARRWRSRLGLPERVFVRVGTETKPTYVDFRSPLYVRALCSPLRSAAGSGDAVSVKVTEMLPTPEQAWVADAEGNRYLSELRIQVSDHG
jgi:surfactin synthase thioesterase subunit